MIEKELIPQLSLLSKNADGASSATGTITFNTTGGFPAITGKTWVWYNDGEYIEVDSDALFYYDIVYTCTGANHHYIGFERYDANKTATSNNSTQYITGQAKAYTNRHINGYIDLSKDINGNPTKYLRLRVLNEWDHSTNQNTDVLTIYRLSLVQVKRENNTELTKTANWISDKMQENDGDWIPINSTQFGSQNSGSYTVSDGESGRCFNITSIVTTNNWGSGITLKAREFALPYGFSYKVRMEVKVTTAHNIRIDHNSDVETGAGWQGNDNDLEAIRSANMFSIPANTWTTIEWYGSNLHPSNTTHMDIYPRDAIGLLTNNDTAAVTWQMRFPQIKIYKDTNTNFSIGKDGTTHANQIYEI